MPESTWEDAKVTVRRVLPSFNTTVTKYTSYVLLGCGVLAISFGATAFGIHAFPSVGGTAILLGIGLLAAGAVGLLASLKFRKEVWAVSGLLILCVCGLGFSLALLGASIVGMKLEASRNPHHAAPRATREAVDIICMILSLCGAGACGVVLGLCIQALYWACCRRRSGVTYVENSPNQVIAESPATAEETQLPQASYNKSDLQQTSISDNESQPNINGNYDSNSNTQASADDTETERHRKQMTQMIDSEYVVLDI